MQLKSRADIEAEVRALLASKLGDDHSAEELPPDLPLFQSGFGLDSMSAVELMTEIESNYKVRIEDDQFDVFDSLDLLVTFLHEHQGSADS